MASSRSFGCATHILIITALLCLVAGYGVFQNWDTFSLMVDNLTIMNEHAAQADALRSPSDLVDYIADHPERASLVAYDVGSKPDGIFYRADTARPLTGVPRLLLLTEYARQIEEGTLDAEARVPLDSVDVLALPGISRTAHEKARSRLLRENSVGRDSSVTLLDIGRSAFRWDDAAAADWILAHLGRPAVQRIPNRVGLPTADPPMPTSGLHLLWRNHQHEASPAARIDTLEALSARDLHGRAYSAMSRLRRDSAFRHTERRRLSRSGSGLSLRQQRTLAGHTAPRGTASAYADLLQRISTETLFSPAVSKRISNHLERSIEKDSLGVSVRTVASAGGATPGLISLAAYARRETDGTPRIVVLLLERLPMAVFYHLLQSSLDKGLFLRLLGDDAFFSRVRDTLRTVRGGRDSVSAIPDSRRANRPRLARP